MLSFKYFKNNIRFLKQIALSNLSSMHVIVRRTTTKIKIKQLQICVIYMYKLDISMLIIINNFKNDSKGGMKNTYI